jgi:hypothetical protein
LWFCKDWIVGVYINRKYKKLVCQKCRVAMRCPTQMGRHMCSKHGIRKQSTIRILVESLGWDGLSIEAMLADGLMPQPYIQVFSRFKCRDCPFLSDEQKEVAQHE